MKMINRKNMTNFGNVINQFYRPWDLFSTHIFFFQIDKFEIVSFCEGKYQSAEGGAATGHRESPQDSVPTFGGHQMVPEQAQEAAANTSRFAGRLELQGKQRAAEQDRFE